MFFIDLILAFVVLAIGEAFIKPLAVNFFDDLILPNINKVFEKVNPKMGEWLQTKTKEELTEAIVDVIVEEVDGFEDKYETFKKVTDTIEKVINVEGLDLKSIAVKRLADKYNFLINAEKLNG